MNSKSLIHKKQQIQEKCRLQHTTECHSIIASIKRSLARKRLSSIRAAAYNLQTQPTKVASVIAHLNNSIGYNCLLYRWFPGDTNKWGKLLIRNQSVGLIVRAKLDSAAEGIKMTADRKVPLASIAPELALSILADCISQNMPKQSNNNVQPFKNLHRARHNDINLPILPNTSSRYH